MTGASVLAHAGPSQVPPALTTGRIFTAWTLEPLPLAVVLLVGGLYLVGVSRLRARGDVWPVGRTLTFLGLGLGSVVIATQSSLATYDTVLLSMHMVQHMVLSMAVPVFLALGAPATLALRTLPPRPRAALLAVLHSRLAAVLSFPVVAGVIFVANPFVLYFSGLYEATLRHPVLHDLNHLHFVLIGCLWFWPLLGIDPMPARVPYGMRVLAVFVTLPFHAFLGIIIMGSSTVIAGDWYAGLHRSWGSSPLADQHAAGGILWGSGDLVGVVVLAILCVQWVRQSEREAVREDRRLDRLEARGPDAAHAAPGREATGR